MDENRDAAAEIEDLDMMANEAILVCGGDMRETIKALLLANAFLEDERNKISFGYARRALNERQAG